MANTFPTSASAASMVVKLMTMHLWEALVMARTVNRQVATLVTGNYRTGGAVTIKKPIESRTNSGAVISTVDDVYQRSFSMDCTTRANSNFQLTSEQLTYDILTSEVSEEILKPKARALAHDIEVALLDLYKKVPNQVGTPGTTPNSTKSIREARARMTYMGVPQEDCSCILDPDAVTEIGENIKSLLHTGMVEKAVQGVPIKGKLSIPIAGFDCYESPNVRRHTVGSAEDDTLLVKTTVTTEDTTIDIKGGTSTNELLEGDIWVVDTVKAVNPSDGTAYTFDRQFVTREDDTVDGSTNMDAHTCIPGTAPYNMRTAGGDVDKDPYQNMNAVPAANDAITVAGTANTSYAINLAYHRNAIALATLPLAMPNTASFKARKDFEGISIRIVADYNILTDVEIYRCDILFGVEMLEPMGACRIIGA